MVGGWVFYTKAMKATGWSGKKMEPRHDFESKLSKQRDTKATKKVCEQLVDGMEAVYYL